MDSFPQLVLARKNSRALPSFFCAEAVKRILKEILPELFYSPLSSTQEEREEFSDKLEALLPIVKAMAAEDGENFSFYMVHKMRKDDFRFFFDLFSSWLVPGKRLNAPGMHVVDFVMPELSGEVYTLCEVSIQVSHPDDLAELMRNLPLIETEARIGLKSPYSARRILEVKGMSCDQKTIFIQEDLGKLIQRSPGLFHRDLFVELQHLLVLCSDSFKSERSTRHLVRIVATQYAFRKILQKEIKEAPAKRHLYLRFFPDPSRGRRVLCLIVGLNFLKDKEVFEEHHLLSAIQNHLPEVRAIPGTFFANKKSGEQLSTFYLEIEQSSQRLFRSEEVSLLRRELAADLKDRIGHLMHPVFMPHNEEEIMRNVLALSSEVRYLRDIPQVFITFDEQSEHHLCFLAILIRVLSPGAPSIQEKFRLGNSSIEYIHDRCKMVGVVRKKYAKEATIFRLKLDSTPFIRQDNSIDLRRARQEVLEELTRLVGEVRDYNGGMISKQHELLCAVRKMLIEEQVKYNELLLENFFYSLTPVVMRTVLEPLALKRLFTFLLDVVRENSFNEQNRVFKTVSEGRYVYAIIKAKEEEVRLELSRALNKLPRQSASMASGFTQVYGVPCLGYVYCCDDPNEQQLFIRTLSEALRGLQLARSASA